MKPWAERLKWMLSSRADLEGAADLLAACQDRIKELEAESTAKSETTENHARRIKELATVFCEAHGEGITECPCCLAVRLGERIEELERQLAEHSAALTWTNDALRRGWRRREEQLTAALKVAEEALLKLKDLRVQRTCVEIESALAKIKALKEGK